MGLASDGEAGAARGTVAVVRRLGKQLAFVALRGCDGEAGPTQLVCPFAPPKAARVGARVEAVGTWRVSDGRRELHCAELRVLGHEGGAERLPAAPSKDDGAERVCLARAGAPRALCRMFLRTGTCPKGAECTFSHDRAAVARAQAVSLEAKASMREALGAPVQLEEAAAPAMQDLRPKSARFRLLAEWLVLTYGLKELQAGGVLDVAGGGGGLSALLASEFGIRCTVVDPRQDGPGSAARATLKRAARRDRPARRRRLERAQAAAGPAASSLLPPPLPEQTRAAVPYCHIREPFEYPMACTDDAAERRRRAEELVQSVALVVGLHADQATEAVVDAALATGRPFAVLPCCAFPSAFAVGDPRATVATTAQLVDYLEAKHESIRRGWLNFQGRNTVLYCAP